jgi:hypothetical protein
MPITTDDDLGSGAIIIELPTARDRPLMSYEQERPERDRCFVHAFVFNVDQRTVRCRNCKAQFEPFDALVEITREWAKYGRQLQAYAHEIKRLEDKQSNLMREVKNLKAQRRRHADRLAAVDAAERCPAINLDKRQCTLPIGHDTGDDATRHYEPGCNYGWQMPVAKKPAKR